METNIECEFVPYEQALSLKELGFNEPCLAHLIGFGDGTIEDGRYKIIQQQVFYPNDDTTSDDKAEELALHPFVVCRVPLFQQAFRFFREKYNLFGQVNIHTYFIYDISNDEFKIIKQYDKLTKTYEEAQLACLIKLIKIVKENNNDK